ncbi:MAG: Crp/Fnr family transcriptional regulator, partial [Gaiellaceae bacterium]
TYPAGTTLFRRGDRATEILIVERGEIELIHEKPGDRLVVRLVHAGSTVDELAVALGAPYPYSAVTLVSTVVLCLRLDTMRALEELFPEIAFRWLRRIACTLESAYERVFEMAGKSALEQVARFLLRESLEQAAQADPLDSAATTVHLTQEEVANSLALSRQTVSRALGDLARDGIVKRGRRGIRILDLEKLRVHRP